MKIKEHISLAPFTTLGVGGTARFFIEAHHEGDMYEAMAFAQERNLPVFILGGGSNVLVPDAGVEGVVLKMGTQDIDIKDNDESAAIVAGAGICWDDIVDAAGKRGVFGIENLAGIPGSLGGAAVQNIGAYGAELSSVFEYADTIQIVTGKRMRISRTDAAFAYRTSFFKKHPEVLIARVALQLSKNARPNISYPDVARVHAAGTPLSTPIEIARTIRTIRAKKFPHARGEGTAGSFFKNPIISQELATSLRKRFQGLPAFPQEDGTVKIPLAWLLDHVLHLKGYAIGPVRLYEEQPLVIVARAGATAHDVDVLARDVAENVLRAIGISIEREVETFGTRT